MLTPQSCQPPQVLHVYLQRAPKDDLDMVLKVDGFHLLANQLYHYPATDDVTHACLTLLYDEKHDVDDE